MKKELCDTINRVLKNGEIIKLLNKENKDNKGFLLGRIEYFDDIGVLIMCGITLDKEDKSKAKIFTYKLSPHLWNSDYSFKTGYTLPEIPKWATCTEYPSVNEINQTVQEIFDDPKGRLIDYSPFLRTA